MHDGAAVAGRYRLGEEPVAVALMWPIPADGYTLLVHCLAGSPDGERPGAAFRATN